MELNGNNLMLENCSSGISNSSLLIHPRSHGKWLVGRIYRGFCFLVFFATSLEKTNRLTGTHTVILGNPCYVVKFSDLG